MTELYCTQSHAIVYLCVCGGGCILFAWNDLLMCARHRIPSLLCFARLWMAPLQKCLWKTVPHWTHWWICTLFMMSVNMFYLVAFSCITDMLHEPFRIYQYEFSVWISRVHACYALGLQIQWPDPERSLKAFCKNQNLSKLLRGLTSTLIHTHWH